MSRNDRTSRSRLIFSWILTYYKVLWYAGILLWSAIYNVVYWGKCIDFKKFDGNNVIFLLLILLLLLPLINDFEVSALGAKFKAKSALGRNISAAIIAEISSPNQISADDARDLLTSQMENQTDMEGE